MQLVRGHSLDTHDLFARALAADDADLPAWDAGALGDQLAECRVGLAVDRRRRDARVQRAVVLANERIAPRTWFEPNRDIDRHKQQYAPPPAALSAKRLDTGERAADDELVHVGGALVGDDRLEVVHVADDGVLERDAVGA
jgi:hypothetical protein